MGMGTGLYHWIQRAFDGTGAPTNGSLVLADFNYKAQSRLDFEDAIPTSITVPQAGWFQQGRRLLRRRVRTGSRSLFEGRRRRHPQVSRNQAKAWLCSNFSRSVPFPATGSLRLVIYMEVRRLNGPHGIIPNAKPVSRPGDCAGSFSGHFNGGPSAPWAEAARKWFIDGERTDASEMSGRIVFLGPNLKDELGEISPQHRLQRFSRISPGATGERSPASIAVCTSRGWPSKSTPIAFNPRVTHLASDSTCHHRSPNNRRATFCPPTDPKKGRNCGNDAPAEVNLRPQHPDQRREILLGITGSRSSSRQSRTTSAGEMQLDPAWRPPTSGPLQHVLIENCGEKSAARSLGSLSWVRPE